MVYSGLGRNIMKKKQILFITMLILTALFLTSCYMIQDTEETGSMDLEMGVSRAAFTNDLSPDDDVWVVGFLIDSVYEPYLVRLLMLEDESPLYDDYLDSMWKKIASACAVRFSNGQPYFQFRMVDGSSGILVAEDGDFRISGIPAGRDYFLYVIVLDEPIKSVDDLTEDPILYTNVRYINPKYYSGAINYNFAGSEGGGPYTPGGTQLPVGWYYFDTWTYSYAFISYKLYFNWTNGEVWESSPGVPVTSQPFPVDKNGNARVRILLSEW
jgi:hypothetical protein